MKLNWKTITETWPLPRVDDLLARLNGSTYYSTLDLISGYWQVEMDSKSKEKTAFSTPDGHYQFKLLPFGLKKALAQFSRMMYRIFGNKSYCEIYLNDIIIHSKILEEHKKHIGLKLKPTKCHWFAKKVRVLVYIVLYSIDKKKENGMNFFFISNLKSRPI
ncbi:unnamed protein product [Brachionus calyciflorus]|uniref:Reverse transcriptase domain-containing protein n=1 Tax=Brachionus calyciflorus TaxID=104777 RepID=A0A813SUM8_9BILA|nr:unnamed protein product [Brachionus calyciflorus]